MTIHDTESAALRSLKQRRTGRANLLDLVCSDEILLQVELALLLELIAILFKLAESSVLSEKELAAPDAAGLEIERDGRRNNEIAAAPHDSYCVATPANLRIGDPRER